MLKIGLVGPTNAGKSLLFNYLLGTHRAIVTDMPGTTRELLRDVASLGRTKYELIDSPGLLDFATELKFLYQIIQEADIILFVVDGKQEMGMKEQEIHQMICKSGKFDQTILVVNKLDGKVYTPYLDGLLAPWYILGYQEVMGVSAEQHEGIEEVKMMLNDRLHELQQTNELQFSDEEDQEDDQRNNDVLHVALIGRPNAGKSTLLNKLSGEEIAHVASTPGTTLDYLRGTMVWKSRRIDLYDTAGMRKKGKIVGLERIAYAKTKSLMEFRHPITVVLIDIEEGLTKRDASLIQEFQEISGPMVVAINKIDLLPPHETALKIKQLQQVVKIPARIPIVSISAKDAIALPKLMNTIMQVEKAWHGRVHTAELNSVVTRAWLTKPPRFPKNKMCKRKYITQVKSAPPTFMVSVNKKEYANFSFISRLEKVIRDGFGFIGCPIRLELREKSDDNPYVDR